MDGLSLLSYVRFHVKKNFLYPPPPENVNDGVIFPTTKKEKESVATIKEITSILKSIYGKAWVVYEVNAAIKSEFYEDETVPLRDLLTPDRSPLYKSQKFLAAKAQPGVFKKAFAEQLQKGDYPNLKKLMGQPPSSLSRTMNEWPAVDTANEIWSDQYGYSIYFPYSEDYPLVTPFDPDINTINGQLVTIVAADREADSAPGYEPYHEPDPVVRQQLDCTPENICYVLVTVDDNYADGEFGNHATHIVGVGAEPSIVNSTHQTSQVYLVFIGDVKLTEHFDKLISLSGNGGGSEIRFIRGSAYLQPNNSGQITNATNTISKNFKRRDKGKWKALNSIWDSDWKVDNHEQIFGIYEDDTQGTKTFSGSLTTTLTVPPAPQSPGGTIVGTYGYSITVQTQDEIIKQMNWDRTSFYQYNQGGLNNGCGTRNGWTIYDCGLGIRYTMPTQ